MQCIVRHVLTDEGHITWHGYCTAYALHLYKEHGGADAAAYNCSSTGGVGGMPGAVHMPGVIG